MVAIADIFVAVSYLEEYMNTAWIYWRFVHIQFRPTIRLQRWPWRAYITSKNKLKPEQVKIKLKNQNHVESLQIIEHGRIETYPGHKVRIGKTWTYFSPVTSSCLNITPKMLYNFGGLDKRYSNEINTLSNPEVNVQPVLRSNYLRVRLV